ncbi:hypothetical protein II906_09380 [bacterium]|nr:hypothetical protein [bacterium]
MQIIKRVQENRYKMPVNGGDSDINKTLKGVLINNHINTDKQQSLFNSVKDELLIYKNAKKKPQEETKESSFDFKKAMVPLLIGTGAVLAGCAGLSAVLKKSAGNVIKSASFEQLPDLALNMNIREEPHFAVYRAVRNPNFNNLLAAGAVFIMTGINIAAKNFVDGTKEIWLKKKSADVEKTLQENLIKVETDAFSGKLGVINDMLNSNINHFDEALKSVPDKPKTKYYNFLPSMFLNFKGEKVEKNNEQDEKKEEFKKNIKYALLGAGVVAGAILLGKYSISNIKKTAKTANDFANRVAESAIDTIQDISGKTDKKDLPRIIELLKSISAKPEYITQVGKKYNLSDGEIQGIIKSVEETRKTIFADAPTALGGIPQKIQYYCYLDENRGHLYNWILHPENKFTKYIFGAFTITSAAEYLFKQGMDAAKEYTVMNENAKTDLNLRKRLVDVEIENFRSKKKSAIQPLVDNFDETLKEGKKSKEELKQMSDNILFETKNGPPYGYT